MARKCSICTHKKRNEIDLALTEKTDSIERISKKYSITTSSINRHIASGHISQKAVKAIEAKEIKEAKTLFDRVKALEDRALSILENAERSGTIRDMCAAIREVRETIKMLATLTGEMKGDQNTVNVAIQMVNSMSDEEVIARAKRAIAKRG